MHVYVHVANADILQAACHGDAHPQRALVEEGDIVSEHLEHRRQRLNADLKASNSEAQTRNTRAARRS